MFQKLLSIPRKTACAFIRLYQKTISPDHGVPKILFPHGYCKFSPSCSMYSHDAIAKFGLLRGGFKGLWRILRCNPFSKGGLDQP